VPMSTVVLEPMANGVRMSVRTDKDELFMLARQLLRLPCPVTIEGPSELLAAARLLAERATALVARSAAA